MKESKIKFVSIPEISTQRLVLRKIKDDDFDNLIDLFFNEEVKQTFILPDFSSREDAEKLARRFKELSLNYNRFIYGVYFDNRLIGFVNDVFIDETTVELGYVIHPNCKNQGYATEVLSACIELIFSSGFTTVKTGAFVQNLASIRVMEKCEMQRLDESEEIEYRGKTHRCVYYQKVK